MELKFLSSDELKSRVSDFCELYRFCFSDYIDENIVIKRYINNPYNDLLMCVAIDEEKIVANYAASPVNVMVDGVKYKAAISLNSMTHPKYSGKGLFVSLANMLYDRMQQKEYALIYGFPNKVSNWISCCKLGWSDVYEIPTLTCELSENETSLGNDGDIVHTKNIKTCDLHFSNSHIISIKKDSEYVKWRYEQHPSYDYRVLELSSSCWAIYKIYQDIINIVEIQHNDNKEEVTSIIEGLKNVAIKNRCRKITLFSSINTLEHSVFERNGFQNRSPIRYFGVRQLCYTGSIDLLDYRNWHISMGDDNVY